VPNDPDNRKRAFAEVVTVEAWHHPFGPDTSKVDLHADVVFATARVGGETNSPVRFRLRMKRADIVVVIPDSEPVVVDKRSVSRDAPQFRTNISQSTETSSAAAAGGEVGSSVSASGLSASAKIHASAGVKVASTQKIEVSGELGSMTVTQSKTADGHYRWTVEPSRNDQLEGRPWDSTNAPRLKLSDRRKDRSRGIPPTVRVEVRCRREDIDIFDLTIKDESLLEKAKRAMGFENRIKAAEAYIRDQLAGEGLEVSNMSDVFGYLTFASTTADTSEPE